MMVETAKCSCFISGNHADVTSNFLLCAPCPPPLLSFGDFITYAGDQNLTDCEIDQIANKCRLDAPVFLDNLTDVITVNITDSVVAPVLESGHPLQLWEIVLITVFSILSMVTLLLVVVFIKNRANGSKDEKSAVKTKHNEYMMQYSSTENAGTVNVGYSSQESITAEQEQANVTNGRKSNPKSIQKDNSEYVVNTASRKNQKNSIISASPNDTGDMKTSQSVINTKSNISNQELTDL